MAVIEPIITASLALITAFISGIALYLVKDKINRTEEQSEHAIQAMDHLADEIEKEREIRSREHEVVIRWLSQLTRSINKSDELELQVKIPDEIYIEKGVDVKEDDISDNMNGDDIFNHGD